MHSLSELRPGDVMFTTISGIGGKAIAIGEKLNDRAVSWDVAKRVQHVAMVTEVGMGYVSVVEAMPDGASEDQIIPDGSHIWVRPEYISAEMMGVGNWDSHGGAYQGNTAANAAREYIGTPYSWLDYAALTAHHLHLPVPWLDRYISTSKHMICSQLVDQAMADAGFHVFDDGRLPQDVTPAALYVQLLKLPGTVIL